MDSARERFRRDGRGARFEPLQTVRDGWVHRSPRPSGVDIGKRATNVSSSSSLIPESSPSRSTVSISPPLLLSLRVQVDVARFVAPLPARVTMIRRLLFGLPAAGIGPPAGQLV